MASLLKNTVTVSVKGIPLTAANLLKYAYLRRSKVTGIVKKYALLIDGTAKSLCAVDTGRLRSSIHVEYFLNDLAAMIGTNVEYAVYVEFGTHLMAGRPFLTASFEIWAPAFYREIKEVMQ